MTTAPQWPEQDVDDAIKLWKEGLSAGYISKALDYRYSRNAVLGKLNRLGYMRNPAVSAKPRTGPKPKITFESAVRRRHDLGQMPSAIANILKCTTPDVVAALVGMGLDPRANVIEPYRVHPMWSMGEDERRQAFYEKFQRGWADVQRRLSDAG